MLIIKKKKFPYAFSELDNQSTLSLKLKMSLTSEGVEASNPFGASELWFLYLSMSSNLSLFHRKCY